jgi:uncharacterized membrane protein YfcA
MNSDPTLTILIAGAAVTIGMVGGAILVRRRGLPLPSRFWPMLALGWAAIIVLGFVLVLIPDEASSVVFGLVFLATGAGLMATAIRERRKVNPPSPLTPARLNRAVLLGALQYIAGVVMLLTVFGQR